MKNRFKNLFKRRNSAPKEQESITLSFRQQAYDFAAINNTEDIGNDLIASNIGKALIENKLIEYTVEPSQFGRKIVKATVTVLKPKT